MKTLEEIIRIYGGSTSDWTQHENEDKSKGAWVHVSVKVFGKYRSGDDGVIRGGEIWGGEIWGGEIWGGEIWGGVIRGGEIWGGVIWGGEWKNTPVQVVGIRWDTNQCSHDSIRCGCEIHTVKEWQSRGFMEKTFTKNGLTASEKKQYKEAILFCISQMKYVDCKEIKK